MVVGVESEGGVSPYTGVGAGAGTVNWRYVVVGSTAAILRAWGT